MVGALCSVIRATGISDSGAAARMSLHPSTVSRWKKESPSFAILLRNAREAFRSVQLEIIFEKAHAGQTTSWRAAAWLLERTFPEDYAPRAKERALFQERFEAICAAEEEGGALELPTKAESLQNVKNPTPPPLASEAPEVELTLPLPGAPVHGAKEFRLPEPPLQNVKNSPLAGPLCPPRLSTKTAAA
jgi:hypothetical protein